MYNTKSTNITNINIQKIITHFLSSKNKLKMIGKAANKIFMCMRAY